MVSSRIALAISFAFLSATVKQEGRLGKSVDEMNEMCRILYFVGTLTLSCTMSCTSWLRKVVPRNEVTPSYVRSQVCCTNSTASAALAAVVQR
jgi:hypothetical protein